MPGVARWPTRLAGAAVLCLLLVAAQGCGSPAARRDAGGGRRAAAATVGEFGSAGGGPGQLTEPFGIAVNQRTGDVYVVDTNASRIERFTSGGTFVSAWGWGVADGKTEALQTCTTKCFEGLAGAGAGQLDFTEGIAVDSDLSSPSYGDVYVVDIQAHRIEKFGPAGRFLLMFGGGVNRTAVSHHDHTEEDICPVSRGDICGAGVEGSTGGQLESIVEGSFIAVDGNGTVYVGQRDDVKAFSADGAYRGAIPLTPQPVSMEGHEAGGVSGLAVNASGDFYVIRHGVVGVNEYSSSGKLLRTLEQGGKPAYPEGPTPSLALDPAGNVFIDVYANERHRIDEYSSSGAKIASFDEGANGPPNIADKLDGLPGMAYDPRTEELYVVNADAQITPAVERVRMIAPPRP
jgi:tripartite motif-containing protein 71